MSASTVQIRDDEKSKPTTVAGPGYFWRKWGSRALWLIKDQWFLLGIALVTIVASQVQVSADQQARKQVVISYLSVTIVFFITGLTLDTKILLANYSKWKHHLFIQFQCFVVTSALAFAVVSLAALKKSFMDPWLLIGLIFNGCTPTTMASNVMFTRQSHGNVALTVVETTIGNFLGPFLSPVLIRMYLSSDAWYATVVPMQSGGYAALYRRVFMQLGLSIYLPMVVGQIIRWFFHDPVNNFMTKYRLNKVGSVALLLMVWQTFDHAFETGAFGSVKTSNMIFVVFVTIVNFIVWLAVCVCLSVFWLDRKDTVSVAMCVPAKSLAMALPMTFLLFTGLTSLQEAKLQIPLVIFQVMQMTMASLSTIVFRRWVDAGEKKDGPKDTIVPSEGSSGAENEIGDEDNHIDSDKDDEDGAKRNVVETSRPAKQALNVRADEKV